MAGRASVHKVYVRHGITCIGKCLQEALEGERDAAVTGPQRFPGVSDQVQGWMNPHEAHQLVRPPRQVGC